MSWTVQYYCFDLLNKAGLALLLDSKIYVCILGGFKSKIVYDKVKISYSKFKLQAFHIRRISYWKTSGSGNKCRLCTKNEIVYTILYTTVFRYPVVTYAAAEHQGLLFQITCLRLKLRRKDSRLQVIKNSAPSVVGWRQCDIRIAIKTNKQLNMRNPWETDFIF